MESECNNKAEQSSLITSTVVLHTSNNDKSSNQLPLDVEQSDSFIRDTILEQQNLNEKKLAKRGSFSLLFSQKKKRFLNRSNRSEFIFVAEDKIKDRLTQLAREKLGILSKEKQLQLERKRRAMAFLNQINGKYLQHITNFHLWEF